jgi:hypothetical integral membrane protein (TIGR02206 family)
MRAVPSPFQLFGWDHLASLVAVALLAVLAVRIARRTPHPVRFGLAGFLAIATAAYLAVESTVRPLDPLDFAPLHLCDMAIFVAIYALLSRSLAAAELLYFWACAGTSLAMITPDVWYAFPHRHFVAYFALHGAVVIAALVLTFGLGIRPRTGAPWRALLLTNVYAACVLIVNLAFGTNFLYLMAKPSAPTLLDFFGPWPIYIATVELIALGAFWLLYALARAR